MAKVAVIDFGTNTFHILIVSEEAKPFKEVYRQRIFVNLAESGIQTLGQSAIERAHHAVLEFKNILAQYELKELKLFGTEALRLASNGHQVSSFIRTQLGKAPEIISGDREAELILKGTSCIINLESGTQLLMDIGGGSVEFILSHEGIIKFQQSLQLGVTVLFNKFHQNDPITEPEIQNIRAFIKNELTHLEPILKQFSNISLIGASGSFEILQSMLEKHVKRDDISTFSLAQFYTLYDQLLPSTIDERLSMDGLPKQRAKLIVVAFILMYSVLELADFQDVIVSPFALKEGAISEMLNFRRI